MHFLSFPGEVQDAMPKISKRWAKLRRESVQLMLKIGYTGAVEHGKLEETTLKSNVQVSASKPLIKFLRYIKDLSYVFSHFCISSSHQKWGPTGVCIRMVRSRCQGSNVQTDIALMLITYVMAAGIAQMVATNLRRHVGQIVRRLMEDLPAKMEM